MNVETPVNTAGHPPSRSRRLRLAAVMVAAPLALGVAAPAGAADGHGPDVTSAQRVTSVQVATPMTVGAVTGARAAGGGSAGAYRFIDKVGGEPVHWNKCKAIGYRVSKHRAPEGGITQAKKAVHKVAAASGLRFDYQGVSQVRPYINQKYQRGTRLVIGWLAPRESKQLQGGGAGYGGPQYYTSGSNKGMIIKGFVQLNASLNKKLADGFGRGPRYGYQGTKGQLLLHEISHAVGLDHVQQKRQIMYPTLTRKKAAFGAGDVNGLRRVGKLRRCF